MNRMECDALVIGGGIGGLTSAIFLAKHGKDVILLNRASDPHESNTRYAQGGIIARGINDSPELLAHDIDVAGDEFGSRKAIRILAEEIGPLVESFLIKEVGVPFDTDTHGSIDFALEAAHSKPRIPHVGVHTGEVIMEKLVERARSYPHITVLTDHTAVDLISSSHHAWKGRGTDEPLILGAYVLDRANKTIIAICAQYTILATGGVGALYRYTTNPDGARGDGIAMAYRAGAYVSDMRYVQFHPTAFRKEGRKTFLISEAMRGKGAILLDRPSGRRFLKDYPLEKLELAPRDELARAIRSEMLRQNLPCVYLDMRPIVKRGLVIDPEMLNACLACGVDPSSDPVPVAPAAHFLCGGVNVDEWGRTRPRLRRLRAVGEVSRTGVHGGNRLASVSLAEALVWGKRAAENICGTFERQNLNEWDIPDWDESDVLYDTHPDLAPYYERLRDIMWFNVGIVRSRQGLREARQRLWEMSREVELIYEDSRLTDELIGLRHAITAAILVVRDALGHRESRGCHFREDEKGGVA
ncbi:MAG: hypothetical protein A2939_00595 [Parcubacteria group bacterium RIFCSPLOWO2_01_FULL_48_18]|nr:MAG: hypothetical protein A2939_00595 [Parcubacteria group bacterium RIFCSPLOWO2_01_FULL_48_18]OHB23203.1 MAG: hypothetical protein A3J67_00400 [Parcubacteria group bacterium RIFCSPHIGHO2_02_FULL_48_10b]